MRVKKVRARISPSPTDLQQKAQPTHTQHRVQYISPLPHKNSTPNLTMNTDLMHPGAKTRGGMLSSDRRETYRGQDAQDARACVDSVSHSSTSIILPGSLALRGQARMVLCPAILAISDHLRPGMSVRDRVRQERSVLLALRMAGTTLVDIAQLVEEHSGAVQPSERWPSYKMVCSILTAPTGGAETETADRRKMIALKMIGPLLQDLSHYLPHVVWRADADSSRASSYADPPHVVLHASNQYPNRVDEEKEEAARRDAIFLFDSAVRYSVVSVRACSNLTAT